MSWPQWQPPVNAQPGMPMLTAAAAVQMGATQYTPEQWQEMQQWVLWQQQYQQWAQMYGAEYQKSLNAMANNVATNLAPLVNQAVPPPLPNDVKPPPPPDEPVPKPAQQNATKVHSMPPPAPQPPQSPVKAQPDLRPQSGVPPTQHSNHPQFSNAPNAQQHQGYNSLPSVQNQAQGASTWEPPVIQKSPTINQAPKRANQGISQPKASAPQNLQHSEAKKAKVDWMPPPVNVPASQSTQGDAVTDPETMFKQQLAKWEDLFNKWKESNQDHPDQVQYRQYEERWIAWRSQLLTRREQMRKKQQALSTSLTIPSASPATTKNLHEPSDSSLNVNALASLFKAPEPSESIPGLDLVRSGQDEAQADLDPPGPGNSNNSSFSNAPLDTPVKPEGLNLDTLSKNINSILGDPKLLNLLSLVAKNTSNPSNGQSGIAAEANGSSASAGLLEKSLGSSPIAGDTSNVSNPSSMNKLDSNSSSLPLSNNNMITRGNGLQTNPPLGFKVKATLQRNNFADFPWEMGDYRGHETRDVEEFPKDCHSSIVARNLDGFSEHSKDMWQPNSKWEQPQVAPAPPSITDYGQALIIDKVINYDHKSKNAKDQFDVQIISPRVFDYRHKLVTRIPLPDRPKWLCESFRNILEFDPPIPQYSRYPPDHYEHNAPSYGRFEKFSPPMYSRPASDFAMQEMHRRRYYNEYFGDREQWMRPTSTRQMYDHDVTCRRPPRKDIRDIDADLQMPPCQKQLGIGSAPFSTNTTTQKPSETFAVKAKTNNKISIDDLLHLPGRNKRPPRIVIILRGPPGSGKTFLAKQIKDIETENGGSAPRILSLDDYFMVEQEKSVLEDGRVVKVREMVYEYEECMESQYRQSLLKTFKKTITDGYFSFIIVDNVNDKVKYFEEMWSFAKQHGFQVYVCQLELDSLHCTKRNVHGRSEVEIKQLIDGWEETPSHYGKLDATNIIQAGAIPEVEMEEINSPQNDYDFNDDDVEEQAIASSKWDNFECSIDNLAKLDGINKPLRSSGTMEDYLQLDEWTVEDWNRQRPAKPGQKRVRWADLEERKQQEKMRAIGFVVGQTDWNRMMDPTLGGSALTHTKYIERVGVRKVNSN